ncbi:MAG: phytanoyl-CoA dioxygenase [Rhodospirillaceae bacterium]|jgi:ectoine hydroxylase-related dioxygenase (phytanoyl-CoA dioxygenase family)|nr:phytanoyl-CoA dioxygenase [Rhodospirillaceae bacterium]MBT5264108.1 phytanoyl-CoA dioxygenase [Rhodospirillaceae bacterium]MBT6136645.1 phytanoyl-CoA dioxygenase [Rhodospirillaceae bacterium]
MLHSEPLREITEEEVFAFNRDGAIRLAGMFDEEWIALLADAVERDKAEPGPMVRYNTPEGAAGEFFVDFQLWQRWDGARQFVTDSPAPAIAARMLGTETVNFYHDHLIVKEPGTAERTPWHQDQPYYPIDGKMIGSIWLPLDPVSRDVCVEYVAGSHRWDRWFAPRYFDEASTALVEDDRFEAVPDIDNQRGTTELLAWDLDIGDCIFFHSLSLHGAPGNVANDRRRRGYATRWLGEDTRFAERPGRISPPIEGHGLAVGDPMDCELFPRVWPRD